MKPEERLTARDAELLARALERHPRSLARLLTAIEDGGDRARSIMAEVYPRAGRALVLGLTGPPGVGKSSLTDALIRHYRAAGLKVGVVAVDPTSPFTGGAILGDRIRMSKHFTDPEVFIRSMATRGQLGGLARATADVVDALDAAGHEVVLVETIGVGQEDIEVSRVVPLALLVLTPGLGDEIQAMKSGIMEVGDVYVINKADLAGADRVEAALHATLASADLATARPIVRTVATEDRGIQELAEAVEAVRAGLSAAESERRQLARSRERIGRIVKQSLLERVSGDVGAAETWKKQAERVARREIDPYAAALEVLASAGLGGDRTRES